MCFVAQPGNALTGLVAVDVASGQQRVFFSAPTSILARPLWLPNGRGLLALSKDQASNFHPAADHLRFLPGRQVVPGHPRRQQLLRPQYLLRRSRLWQACSTKVTGICSSPPLARRTSRQQVSTGSPIRGFHLDPRQPAHHRPAIHAQPVRSRIRIENRPHGRTRLAAQPAQLLPRWPHSFCAGIAWRSTDPDHLARRRKRRKSKTTHPGQNCNNYPVCSPDGNWVLFVDSYGRRQTFQSGRWTAALPQPVSDLPVASRFDISPDGKTVAFATLEHLGEHEENLALVDIATGQPQKLIKFERDHHGAVRFTPDGKAVVYPFATATSTISGSKISTAHRESKSPTSNPKTSATTSAGPRRHQTSRNPGSRRLRRSLDPRPAAIRISVETQLRCVLQLHCPQYKKGGPRPPDLWIVKVAYAGFTFSACQPLGPLTTSN